MIIAYKNAELGYEKTEVDVQKKSASPEQDTNSFPQIIADIDDSEA